MNQLPKTWYITEIENILKPQQDGKLIHQGWSPRCHTEAASDGEWGVLKTTAIQDGYFLEEYNKKLPSDKEPKERIEVKAGDLLMTNAGPRKRCGVTTFVKEVRDKLMLSGKMYRMRFDETKVYPKYVESYLRTQEAQKQIDQRKTGMSESGLNLTQQRFLSVPVVMCPFDEQKRIANKLDSVLAKIKTAQARLDKVPAILQRFRQSIYNSASNGDLTESWREYTGEGHWATSSLINLIQAKPRNGKSPKGVEFDTGIRNLTLSAVTQGFFIEDKYKFVDIEVPEESYLWVKKGDILLQRANSLEYVGISAIYKGKDNKYIYPDLIMKFRANESVLPEFLHFALLSDDSRRYLRKNATGTAGNMPKVNQATVSNIPIQITTLVEQTEIVRIAEELLTKADSIEKQYQEAKLRVDKMTQSILARAFSGKLFSPISDDDRETGVVKTRSSQSKQTKTELAQENTKAQADRIENKLRSQIKVESTPTTEDNPAQAGEVFTLLKSNNKGMSAQALFDGLSDNTFSAIDDLFSELKKLIEQKVVIQAGEGENSTFKVAKK